MTFPTTSGRTREVPHGLVILLVFALIGLWAVGLFYRSVWTPDEPREADIAWRMSTQAEKALPQLAGVTFAEKPPLSYWMSSAAVGAFGASAAALRVPNALYAIMTVAAIFLLLYSMKGWQTAFIGAVLVCSAFEIFRVGIWLAPDACLLAGCAVALAGLYRGYVAATGRQKLLWYSIMHAGSLMAFMAKSGMGWIVPGLTLLVLLAWEGRWKELRSRQLWFGFFIQLIGIGVWIGNVLQHVDGVTALRVLFWDNLMGRFTHISHHAGASDYTTGHRNWPGKYLVEMPYYLLPWFLLLIAALRSAVLRAREGSLDTAWRFAIASWLPLAVLLSLAATARDTYFAPAILGISVLIALWAEQLGATSKPLELWMLRGTRWLIGAVGFLIIGVLYVLHRNSVESHERIGFTLAAVVIAVMLAFTLLRSSRAQASTQFRASILWCALGFTATLLATAVAAFPTVDRWQDLRSVAQGVQRDTQAGELAVFNPDETTIAILDYYTQREVVALEHQMDGDEYSVQNWLTANPSRRLLVLLPQNARNMLGPSLARPRRWQGINGSTVESLLQKHAVVIAARYEVPHGRNYVLLAPHRNADAGAMSARN